MLKAVPCFSTAEGIFMLQLHWCNKGLWSPWPDPELGTQDWVTPALPLQRLINRVECMYKHKRKPYTISITLKCEVCCGAPDEGNINSTWGKIKPEKPLQRGLSDAGDGWSPVGHPHQVSPILFLIREIGICVLEDTFWHFQLFLLPLNSSKQEALIFNKRSFKIKGRWNLKGMS